MQAREDVDGSVLEMRDVFVHLALCCAALSQGGTLVQAIA